MLHRILNVLSIRVDSQGDGHFGTGRGTRKHMGIDYVTKTGESVYAPINGTVTVVKPYANDVKKASLSGVNINNSAHRAEIYYMEPLAAINGKFVKAGEQIGVAQNMSKFYPSGMKNHVHFELFDKQTQKYINYENDFFFQ